MPSHFWQELQRASIFGRPRIPAPLASARDFAAASVLCLVLGYASERLQLEPGLAFTWSALAAYALLAVAIRIAAAIAARALARPAISLSIACVLMIAAAIAIPVAILVGDQTRFDNDPGYGFGMAWMIATGFSLPALSLSLRGWAPEQSRARRLLVAALVPLLCFYAVHRSDAWSVFHYDDGYAEEIAEAEFASGFGDDEPFVPLDVDSEDLLAVQDDLIDAHLNMLLPQRAGTVDLYLVALAGDGGQDVFRKEADYVQQLFDERFGTGQRSITLINHRDTLAQTPMATLRNLRRALDGIGRKIDPQEDMVLLFMTSHGSAEHEWSAQLGAIPLRQIMPDDLAEAFDNAGIRWRLSVISACYSGGFVDALAGDTSLVITASRADRTSFGCSNDADLTYFGRAYFAQALQTTDDLIAAHHIALGHVREREATEELEASEPQISVGSLVTAKLAQWRAPAQH